MNNFNDILPMSICELYVKPLDWSMFTGNPDASSNYDAHIFWNISYIYSEQKLLMRIFNNQRQKS